ncbi:ATP-dependent helicase HrpB [Maricurvus nonylphenolicus]|uniref:ATP-dependent helicase HrpB n=1 Tax=Maricurvus nonylphenolicus TaxID=1008307 RepID=UPI0036F2AE73
MNFEKLLPIFDVLPALTDALQDHDETVLEAPPGAGKTTCVPLAMLEQDWLGDQKILMLEPRRLAARAAAERMAELLGEPVGQRVGYRVRLDTCVSEHTQIEVVTEGILTRMLQDDPSLDGIGLLIFDEFHERSLDADLGLALTLQGRELFGDLRDQPLKLLVMSATLDGAQISELLADANGDQAPVISSEGRMHLVTLHYGEPYQYGERIVDRVVRTVQQAVADETGSILVFLPGQGEIRQAHQRLQEIYNGRDDLLLTPLFGDLKLAEQRRAIAPAPTGKRKIVLATSIAETSLTIDGVRVVIDSGLSRLPAFDPNAGMTRLHTQRLSKASATQRMGRAGRLEPGSCYRLWSQSQQDELRAFTPPEIEQADLAPLALQLLRWGVDNPADLQWLDVPAKAPYQQALDLLVKLKAVEGKQLTAHGEAMASLPTHPRLAHMILMGQRYGLGGLACDLAALLAERDLIYQGPADIQLRLQLLHGERQADRGQKVLLQRIKQQAKQFHRLLRDVDTEQVVDNPSDECWPGFLLACAYPDRIAHSRRDGGTDYKLSNGRSASFTDTDGLQKHRWLVVANLGGRKGQSVDRIFLAVALDQNLFEHQLAEMVEQRTQVEWSKQQDKLLAEKQRCIGALVLEREPLTDLDPQTKQVALLEVVRQRGLSLLRWSDDLRQWCARIELLRAADSATDWPDMSEDGLLASIEDWLAPYLDQVNHLKDFSSLDLKNILAARLPWPLPQTLDEQAPLRYPVPSGSNITIDYTQNPPVLAVKLQEMFGCQETPTIANGRIALMVHLLSPAQRPLQVTQDLAGFWRGSYEDVKKEMKGRYPKHPWPDNPLEAIATAKTKKRM